MSGVLYQVLSKRGTGHLLKQFLIGGGRLTFDQTTSAEEIVEIRSLLLFKLTKKKKKKTKKSCCKVDTNLQLSLPFSRQDVRATR